VGAPLTAAFLAALPGPASAGAVPPPPADLEARLAEAAARGRAAWPGLELPPVRFAAFLGARASSPAATLEALPLADLYLACACAEGVPGALEAFKQEVRPAVVASVCAVDSSPELVDEVTQSLEDKLFVGGPGRPPAIATYAGRGPLRAWVGVAAQRATLLLLRGESALARAHQRALDKQPIFEGDAELAHLQRLYKGPFEAAFRDAFRTLGEHDRALLSLHHLSGLTLDQLGASYGVNPSTIHRWLASARGALRDEIERLLRERLHVSPGDLASLARLVGSQLDISIASLLRVDPTAKKKPEPPST
jgi:RNA polymerase sigma-70 factor (ECF subfamily)